MGGGGGWGHHLPLLFSGLDQLPLVVTLKMRRGAAELRPPRRLSLHSRPANFGQPLRQVHVHIERRAGGVGGQACLRLVRFPSRRMGRKSSCGALEGAMVVMFVLGRWFTSGLNATGTYLLRCT